MERKIIQICAAESEEGRSIIALCNDGTVWDLIESVSNISLADRMNGVKPKITKYWKELPQIPQIDDPF